MTGGEATVLELFWTCRWVHELHLVILFLVCVLVWRKELDFVGFTGVLSSTVADLIAREAPTTIPGWG